MGKLCEVILTMSLLTALLTSLAFATSDPLAYLCDPICWEENALSDQCIRDRCSRQRTRSRGYRKCKNRCWKIVAPCRIMCADHAYSVLDTCQDQCQATDSADDDCEWSCYINSMLTIRGRILPPDYLTLLRPRWQASSDTGSVEDNDL